MIAIVVVTPHVILLPAFEVTDLMVIHERNR